MSSIKKMQKEEQSRDSAVRDILDQEINKDDTRHYKTERYGPAHGQIKFTPGLPNEDIIQALLNNKTVITAHSDIVQKVLNMEWQWFERRVIKWLGDTDESRSLQESLRQHIKNEKKWIKRGAKADEVGLFK
jgi:diketogulonate reductase-like aldo/keto reductase|tara:strand:- start:2862 stop:3257 length:396 start_codon:yes stop_codon:yes gene_type:complete